MIETLNHYTNLHFLAKIIDDVCLTVLFIGFGVLLYKIHKDLMK